MTEEQQKVQDKIITLANGDEATEQILLVGTVMTFETLGMTVPPHWSMCVLSGRPISSLVTKEED